jgi:hypothetical protein
MPDTRVGSGDEDPVGEDGVPPVVPAEQAPTARAMRRVVTERADRVDMAAGR